MKILIGLGNPGEKYAQTRHNLGFCVLDSLLEKYKHTSSVFWHEDKKLKSLLKTIQIEDQDMLLVKPQTYMNLSGDAVQKVMQEYKVSLADLTVVHDDLDLPFGSIRVQRSGGSAGHNGVQSIMDTVGENFYRVRIGIGRPTGQVPVEDYVLQEFSDSEKIQSEKMISEAVVVCEGLLTHGYETYMSKYYKKQ